ncbi:type II toxin-antitoxin system prevent-host-death family antitoxin [Methylobacterium sp. A54F]
MGEARRGEPSVITRHGRREAVVISFEEWERLSRVPSFGSLLMAAPSRPAKCPNATQARRATRSCERCTWSTPT